MAARALWKGAIAFGLVHIPVELFPAEEHKSFSFSMLDKRDFSPVGFKRYSKKTGKEVPWADVVKGYEYEKDQYVVLSDEDFRRADVKASRTIDIEAFVPASAIPATYFETPYYLVPTAAGQKVYALLRETLKASDRVGVAQLVIRTAKHLAMVAPVGRVLLLNTLRYGDELRGTSGFELPAEGTKAAGVTPKEVELAKRLIDDMASDWRPENYKDTYHEDLLARIHEKIKQGQTKEITAAEDDGAAKPRSAEVIDLAALLERSLGKGGARSQRSPPPKPASEPAKAAGRKTAAKRAVAAKVVRKRRAA